MNWGNLRVGYRSSVQAFIEIFMITLPLLIWMISLRSMGHADALTLKSPATTFLALSLWLCILRDGLKAFNRDNEGDRFQREIVTLSALMGVILCAVLLTMAVENSVDPQRYILSFHSSFNLFMICAGGTLAWLVKAVLIQRKDYNVYFS